MFIYSNIRISLAASLLLLLFACNSNTTKEAKNDKGIADSLITPLPPTISLPKEEKKMTEIRCFESEGLKYKTDIRITMSGKEVSGDVASEEMGTGKMETTSFQGIANGDVLTVAFKDIPPVIGAASEWPSRPWTITKDGKETLHIIFNAKNYETNKWENTEYEFALVDCK